MSKMRKSSRSHKPILNVETKHARWFVTALITSAAWMAVGCFLALIQGDSIDMFRWFWPFIYFPRCSVMLIYPHLVVHKLIQKEKRVTLSTYQDELEEYLAKSENKSSSSQIERTNYLAQLVDRITASPNYVFDFGIAARTLLPLVINVFPLFLKASVVQS